jgi:hypothetical protein
MKWRIVLLEKTTEFYDEEIFDFKNCLDTKTAFL